MNPRIPRVAHYYWHSGRVPGTLAALVRRFLAINPRWTAAVWSAESVGPLVNQHPYDLIDRLAFKADVVRYEKLALHGGHWRDFDLIPLRPIEPLLHAGVVLAEEAPGRFNNGWWACEPGHPFAWRLVSGLEESFQRGRSYGFCDQVGVAYFNRVAAEFRDQIACIPPVLVHPYYGKPPSHSDYAAHPTAFDIHFFNSNNLFPRVQKYIDAGKLAIPDVSDTSVNTRLFGMTPDGQTGALDIAEAVGYAT